MREHHLIINSDVFDKMLRWFSDVRPKEGYCFLGGSIKTSFSYVATHIYMPIQNKVSKNGLYFSHQDIVDATAWASKNGGQLLGIAHSHPYQELNWYGALQSITDGQMHASRQFPISVIVTFFGDKAAITCWPNGFTAPIDISTKVGRRLKSLHAAPQMKLINI